MSIRERLDAKADNAIIARAGRKKWRNIISIENTTLFVPTVKALMAEGWS